MLMRLHTLCIVLLLLHTRPVDLADSGGCFTCLWLLIVAALVEDLWQVGSMDLPELLIVVQSSTQVPVFTCRTKPKSASYNKHTNQKTLYS